MIKLKNTTGGLIMATTKAKNNYPKKSSTNRNKESDFSFFENLMQPGFNTKRSTRRGKSEFKGFMIEGSSNSVRYYLETEWRD